MPISGVDVKDLKKWMGVQALKALRNLESRSWTTMSSNGVALHPIIRDVIRHELPFDEIEAQTFLKAFNDTIAEDKTWHYPVNVKSYYADICFEMISRFNKINEYTLTLYKNIELLFSFGIRPKQAVELGTNLYNYSVSLNGESCYESGYYAFQIGWTYYFNMQLEDPLKNARKWLNHSYNIFSNLDLKTEAEFAYYGHLISHLSRVDLLSYEATKDNDFLLEAEKWGKLAIENAEKHFDSSSPFYSRRAVAYMQLAEVYVDCNKNELALNLINDSYNIMFSLFGEEDPDTLNVSSRKSLILYNLDRYSEAYALGKRNLEYYDKYFGETNYLRFEQLVTVFKCCLKVGSDDEKEKMREEVIKIGQQLLSEDSEQLKELMSL